MIEGFLTLPAPRMPPRDSFVAWMSPFAISAAGHAVAFLVLLAIVTGSRPRSTVSAPASLQTARLVNPRIVFLPSRGPGGGGGGGGNRQPAPIRRAERVGHDRMTVPVARPLSDAEHVVDVPAPSPQILLDARPLESGVNEQIGALEGGVGLETSQGPGSGGGVGDGAGTGIGSGQGPGLGPGVGGGTGGGVYRLGGGVMPPTILSQVRPSYTNDALRRKVQGTVILELIVRGDGEPSDIRVVRSLDPRGLDAQAVAAVQQWRFNPGRLGGTPVDILVTVVLDFSIH
jgi:protein TonB